MEHDGNHYDLITTDAGTPTFRHRLTKEVLHAQVGPYQEATQLYLEPSGLLQRSGSATVYDCGLGVGTLLLATREAFLQNKKLSSVHCVSFDLEKKGIAAILENLQKFSYAQPHKEFLEAINKVDQYSETSSDGRKFFWEFRQGDFATKIQEANLPKCNVIFFDLFSPQSLPRQWSFSVFERLYDLGDVDAVLITYSSATAARTNLFAAGFYVGYGIPSGKINYTTFAAKDFSKLAHPIEADWLKKYEASHLKHVPTEDPNNYPTIEKNIRGHSQLQQPNKNTNYEDAISTSLRTLASPQAAHSLQKDPYWPKWNSPWWHALLLFELGEISKIPKAFWTTFSDAIEKHYVHFFPYSEKELEAHRSILIHVMCHCGLASSYQMLRAVNFPVDEKLPWIRQWFLKYQLPDGGCNCDESVYLRTHPNSSIVSTLPVLEALLMLPDRSEAEEKSLNQGAEYIKSMRLFRSRRTGKILDESWLSPFFPHFYEYDMLRGMIFLIRWSELRNKKITDSFFQDAIRHLDCCLIEEYFDSKQKYALRKHWTTEQRSRVVNKTEATNVFENSSSFPLLDHVMQADFSMPILQKMWLDARKKIF